MKHLWLKNVKYRACKSESEKTSDGVIIATNMQQTASMHIK